VYLSAARLLTLDPGEVMLVAAHPWDLKGARAAGLRSALVRRPLEYGPNSPQRDDAHADHVVDDLPELAARLSSRG
jgi:2-haloacid dehalogenase